MPSPLEPFIPKPDVRERFETTIEAPAALVMEEATGFDLYSLRSVRTIFRLREKLMGASPAAPRKAQGLLAETRALGWGVLEQAPDRIVCGAACQPWLADVKFAPIPPDRFAAFAEPDQVKIAWTLEARTLAPARSLFVQETRVVATDASARRKFGRYWRWARFGIVGIRLLMMPAVRRAAERRWRARRISEDEGGERRG